MAAGKVLVLGADGFIGRHIAFALRAAGWDVTAQARRTGRLQAMGFHTLEADLANPACHEPTFWQPHLPSGAALVNAAGLLTGSETDFAAVHHAAPLAALAALDGLAILISAVGIDAATTPFAFWRRETEALFAAHTILRPGLVLADTSNGGSSLLRAFASLPCRLPVVGQGAQLFNPIHTAFEQRPPFEHPGIGAARELHETRRPLRQVGRQPTLEEIGGLHHVVIDAHEDHVVQFHRFPLGRD